MAKEHTDAEWLTEAAGTVYAALSPRERAVLLAAARGAEDKQIAADLGCTLSTVRTLWQRIYKKTRTVSRRRLVATLWEEACQLASCHFLNDVTAPLESPHDHARPGAHCERFGGSTTHAEVGSMFSQEKRLGVSLGAAALGMLSLLGDAHAYVPNFNTHGVAFQAYNSGEANDFERYGHGIRASASTARYAIASVTRAPVPGDSQYFDIQGDNAPGETTYLTLFAYDLFGYFRDSVALESSDPNYWIGATLSVGYLGSYGDDVYVSVLARLPASYGGTIYGVTAYQY